jgi:hypothetical protein
MDVMVSPSVTEKKLQISIMGQESGNSSQSPAAGCGGGGERAGGYRL